MSVPGIDVPDARGRTGLDRAGRDLTGNPDVVVRDVHLLASSWNVLRRTTLARRRRDGAWLTEQRDTYDAGDAAALLLHDVERGTVLLSRQFRFAAYANGHPDGMLVEVAAGALDGESAEAVARREAEEELGVSVADVEHAFDAFMSPGAMTQRIHCFAAPYRPADRTSAGGGLADEGEDIEVVELPFSEALAMVDDGRIADAKTIMLLQWAALRGPFRG
ncbi:NUDIX domain-containing protein [Blastococcus goldschmidtiae]|uniref:NUDIX domain-containing protein n=1 Tax=Blastococcus goldschmidtiae TaxID=3075546 RepID=A0ABU2K352_9ACTN|nr:NUDIX domain-containing protein [Blastococcus sp. DSM 46792]MDT0274608.1 NUDIX domain-containing protein [Blastococcus sp. DSM 46792]